MLDVKFQQPKGIKPYTLNVLESEQERKKKIYKINARKI